MKECNENRQGVPRTRVQPFGLNVHQVVCVTCMRASLVRRDGITLQYSKRYLQQAIPCARTMMFFALPTPVVEASLVSAGLEDDMR
jgi:hypothetical protein